MNHIRIGIVDYPGVLQSAVQGLKEMFFSANRICAQQQVDTIFELELYTIGQITEMSDVTGEANKCLVDEPLHVVILAPCLEGDYHFDPDAKLKKWLIQQHKHGTMLCSVCAGAFILAACGVLKQRPATTHWGLAERFGIDYPDVQLDSNKILINDGDIITVGGLMAWLDLGLELVAQFAQPQIMRQLGKFLIVDTGLREQRYYRSFVPKLNHGDTVILNVQHHLQANFQHCVSISSLASLSYLGERTFLRRFVKATGLKPIQYLQQLRIQKACDLIESSQDSFETIAAKVGYEDVSAFRKIFIKIIGLTPREFRSRFG